MRSPDLKPAQIRALLFLLVLVPLIPGVLMLRLMFTAIAIEHALEEERTADLYRQALRIARPALISYLESARPAPEALPKAAVQFLESAFGEEVTVAVMRGDEVLAGVRPPDRKPLAVAALPLTSYLMEVYAAPGMKPNAEGADQIRRFIWSSASALAVSLGIAALAAVVVSRHLHLHELENTALATVAHELKTPLASSRVLLDTLLEGRALEETRRRDYLEILRRENTRLVQLVEAFLESGRGQRARPDRETVAVAELVREAVDATQLSRPESAGRIIVTASTASFVVRGEREALITALGNLIENALKFSTGLVRVETGGDRREVWVTVSDSGIGIARKDHRRIFQRFYQVDRKLSRVTEGCGLGLSIVREIIEAHGGRVHLRSKAGAGTVFTITLPAAESPAS